MSQTSKWVADLARVRDEITVECFGGFGAHDREASMALAKIDEAVNWLHARGLRKGTHLLVDKDEYVRKLQATAPGTTVTTDGSPTHV